MDPAEPTEHPDELLLPYVENILSLEERARVESHVQACRECSDKAEHLKHTIGLLKEHRQAFCPELWELYAFVHYHQDDKGTVATHLNECQACRAICEACTRDPLDHRMPDPLRHRLKERLEPLGRKPSEARGGPFPLSDRLRRFFTVPSLAAAAAAAVILIVVLSAPREIPQHVIAASTVEWQGVSKPKTFQPSRRRLAIVIALTGFAEPMPQAEVDALYRAIAPDMDLFERFEFVTPATVSQAIRDAGSPPLDTNGVLTILRTRLGVTRALIITVHSSVDGVEIQTEMVDLVNRYSIGEQTERLESRSDLEPKIRSVVYTFFQSHGLKEKNQKKTDKE